MSFNGGLIVGDNAGTLNFPKIKGTHTAMKSGMIAAEVIHEAIENNNIGWATIQQVIDREYPNLFYTSKDLQYIDVAHQMTNRYRSQEKNMVAGFSTTMKTRPLIIAKLEEYFRDESVVVHSNRLIDELFTFIYNNNRAEAMAGYNLSLIHISEPTRP